jgi:hypothetical protein
MILGTPAWAQTPLVKDSPFASPGAPAAAPRPADPFELIGVIAAGDKTRICIQEAATRQSRWIAVGGTAGNLQVLSYDPELKQAVILAAGARLTLALHEQPAGAGTTTTAAPDAKARDARLLTGDLLAVGQQQREAYAKAHPAGGN